MSSSRFPLPVKIEHNNSFADHDYCFKETGIMDEQQSSFFVDVENEDENDYNARGRKRRNVKQPELFSTSKNNTSVNSSTGKRVAKAKPRKSVGKGGKKVEKVKYEVEYIWGKRADKMKPGKLEYRVFWKTYPIEESSWEPEENLRACQESIDKYEQREMYFNEKGEKEMHAKTSQENNVRVVVVNKAKTLRQVLPTMHAPRAASVSRTMSIPALPKKNKNAKPPAVHNQKKPSPKKAIVVTTKRHLAPPPSPPPSAQSSDDAHLAGAKKRKSSSSASSFNGSSSTVAAAVTSAHSVSSNNNNGKGEFINSEMGAKTIEELAAKLHAKQVVDILGHEPCDIDGVPYVFRVRFGDDSVKRVIMRDLLDNAPRTLAEYLANAMKRAEAVGY